MGAFKSLIVIVAIIITWYYKVGIANVLDSTIFDVTYDLGTKSPGTICTYLILIGEVGFLVLQGLKIFKSVSKV